jgi:hypothetical protein
MKAVYTFCTKFFDSQNYHGGFPDAEAFWCSCTLSVLLAKRQFGRVVLYTDSRGALLLERLRLPFDEVHIVFDDFAFPHHLWMASKLQTYRFQTEPFVHIDLDAYLWQPLPTRLTGAAIVAQSSEEDFRYYHRVVNYFLREAGYLPDFVRAHAAKYGHKVRSLNAGIYGGHNLSAIHACCDAAMATIAHPANKAMFADLASHHGHNGGVYYDFNILLEQYYASVYYHEHQIEVSYVLSDLEPPYFTHLLGDSKCRPDSVQHLKKRVAQDYPDYYRQVLCLAA